MNEKTKKVIKWAVILSLSAVFAYCWLISHYNMAFLRAIDK
jgi:hypothetical protein|tara:strand:+ start:515 stop:637 length:123 start_codon:yes stop_codon:yes gene_type:complete